METALCIKFKKFGGIYFSHQPFVRILGTANYVCKEHVLLFIKWLIVEKKFTCFFCGLFRCNRLSSSKHSSQSITVAVWWIHKYVRQFWYLPDRHVIVVTFFGLIGAPSVAIIVIVCPSIVISAGHTEKKELIILNLYAIPHETIKTSDGEVVLFPLSGSWRLNFIQKSDRLGIWSNLKSYFVPSIVLFH